MDGLFFLFMIERGKFFFHIRQKFSTFPWSILAILFCMNSICVITLYSAGNASWQWAKPQVFRYLVGYVGFFIAALLPSSLYEKSAYFLYLCGIVLLVVVAFLGQTHMGAQRWLQIGSFHIGQPSEMIKLFFLFALARFFHKNPSTWRQYGGACFLALPALVLIFAQPDLGTALILFLLLVTILWSVGLSAWFFASVVSIGIPFVPFFWSLLRPYQQKRIITFFSPDSDILGAGYHVFQSKISMGSGELWGKGFTQGTQSRLLFLPEHHTDFIFTTFSEEWGLVGGILLLFLYGLLLWMGYRIFFRVQHLFGQLVVLGVNLLLFFHVFLNIAMVMGLFPVVGIPLPFLSYGGSSLWTFMMAYGIVCSLATDVRYGPLPISVLLRKTPGTKRISMIQ